MLGTKLRQLRKQKGLTLLQVAKKANLSISFLSEIETNQKKPNSKTLLAIGSALGLTKKELEEMKIDVKLKDIGMTSPNFTMMFKEIAIGKMSLDEKRQILDAYNNIKHQREKHDHKEGGATSHKQIRQ